MPTNRFDWVAYKVPEAAPKALAALLNFGRVEAAGQEVQLPDLRAFPSPEDKAKLLLHTAAEIEHALMVQYLYAAYSLKAPEDVTEPSQKVAVRAWRGVIAGIAREEMGHLMTVQNLLLLLRLPLNLEREDMPPPPDLYPFPLVLAPLTQQSLARYVVAESPVDATGIEDIVELATGGGTLPVNRVGVLYALLGLVFYTAEQVQEPTEDPWKLFVQKISEAAYQQQPPDAWHLPDGAFDSTTLPQQATDADWGPGPAIRIFTASTRAEAVGALRDIGLQGEGPSTDDREGAHFERFRKVFRGDSSLLPFPATGDWEPTHAVPTMPVVTDDPDLPNGISQPDTQRWARLADTRYALLLGLLEQFLVTAPDQRKFIRDWALQDMRYLRSLSAELIKRRRSLTIEGHAALPFTLPARMHLPEDPKQQWELHRDRISTAISLAEDILRVEGANAFLEGMVERDKQRLTGIPSIIERGRVRTRFDEVREILDAAMGDGAPYHDGLGAFWHEPLADFLAKPIYGLKVVETEGEQRGSRSMLVKALRGEAPFDDTEFRRMPQDRDPVPDEQIQIIVKWIDDGCPEDPV